MPEKWVFYCGLRIEKYKLSMLTKAKYVDYGFSRSHWINKIKIKITAC